MAFWLFSVLLLLLREEKISRFFEQQIRQQVMLFLNFNNQILPIISVIYCQETNFKKFSHLKYLLIRFRDVRNHCMYLCALVHGVFYNSCINGSHSG